ncbi:hypothetical protein [uncultured Cedecea sp.]|uniref:hypothetical protein n=1 Tax=uncultured Cedecea sp. TaxID=988762 RepID=UPI002602693C|nr:hypothetical protein [uncultured Cedecea sp.]
MNDISFETAFQLNRSVVLFLFHGFFFELYTCHVKQKKDADSLGRNSLNTLKKKLFINWLQITHEDLTECPASARNIQPGYLIREQVESSLPSQTPD